MLRHSFTIPNLCHASNCATIPGAGPGNPGEGANPGRGTVMGEKVPLGPGDAKC